MNVSFRETTEVFPLNENYSLQNASRQTDELSLVHTEQPLYLGSPLLVTQDGCDGLLCINLWDVHNATNLSENADPSLPSGYNWQVLLLLLLVIAGVMGNVLVCIAITIEPKLQNVTNYFLLSLSVADLFVCIIVMPASIANELMGYWPFGIVACDLYQVLDVMMCTSSIMHMCTISLDRYVTISSPLKTRRKSRTAVGIKMAVVWLISLTIASPIILLSVLDPNNVLLELPSGLQCGIFNHYFLIYGSLAAFFVPLIIMLIAYTLTIRLLSIQAKKCSQRGTMRRSLSKKHSNHRMPDISAAKNGVKLGRIIKSSIDRGKAHPSEMEPLHRKQSSDQLAVQQEVDISPRSPIRSNNTSFSDTATEKPPLGPSFSKRPNTPQIPRSHRIIITKTSSCEKNDMNANHSSPSRNSSEDASKQMDPSSNGKQDYELQSVGTLDQNREISSSNDQQSTNTNCDTTESCAKTNHALSSSGPILSCQQTNSSINTPSIDPPKPENTNSTKIDQNQKKGLQLVEPLIGKNIPALSLSPTSNSSRSEPVRTCPLATQRSNSLSTPTSTCLSVPASSSLRSNSLTVNTLVPNSITHNQTATSLGLSLKFKLSQTSLKSNSSGGSQSNHPPPPGLKFQSMLKKHSGAIKVAGAFIAKREENIKKKQLNSVRTERKAVKVLGTMFIIFVICWAPFFSVNFAMGVCATCDFDINLFKVFLWLGYTSSTLNPIIYTIFNKTFKRTFIRILKCGHCKNRPQTLFTAGNKVLTNGNHGAKVKYRYGELPKMHNFDNLQESNV